MFYKLTRGICSQTIVRNFHSSLICQWRRPRLNRNPGIDYQQSEFKDEFTSDLNDELELESDFMNVHRTHRELDKLEQKDREKLRNQIVKQKYFKEQRLPNLLTFAEKERIRLLHANDPEEWTIDRLAESFPATIEIIQKIIKSNWQPYKPNRIKKHDETVMQNWQKLLNDDGDSYLPPHVKEHVMRFAERRSKDLQMHQVTTQELSLPITTEGEFASLITSCSRYAKEKEENEITNPNFNTDNPFKKKEDFFDKQSETYLLGNVKRGNVMRLDDAKISNLIPQELNQNSTVENQNIETNISSSSTNNHLATTDFVQKFESTAIEILPEDRKRFEMHQYKDRIHIPRKIYKKNATYRVNDCYYHSDGDLLYRVPGMDGQSV